MDEKERFESVVAQAWVLTSGKVLTKVYRGPPRRDFLEACRAQVESTLCDRIE